jgi:hypothetical protein
MDESDTPAEPSTFASPAIRPALRDQRVRAGRYGDRYEVQMQIGTVQPGRTEWSDEPFYIGARQPVTAEARIQIFANNLRAPVSITGEIQIDTQSMEVSVEDITKSRNARPPE